MCCARILDLVYGQAKRIFPAPNYIFICGLWMYHIPPHYPHKRHDFRKRKNIEQCVSFDSPCNFFLKYVILRRIERVISINVHSSSYKVTDILVRFYLNFNFLGRFSEKHSNIKFHENPSSGSRVSPYERADGRSVMTK
jgi:hypothetical protein